MSNKKDQIGYRPTWAEVNLSCLDFNFRQIKKLLKPQTKVMVTVKADAYGHGLLPVSKRLLSLGADFFGVASIDEGIKLRQAGFKVPILVLGAILRSDILPVFKYGLTVTVCDLEFAYAINSKAKSLKKKANVHIKVDTGMGRIGFAYQDAGSLIRKIKGCKFIDLEGIFTHFAFADMDKDFTLKQIQMFNRLIDGLRKSGINIPLAHAANSAGVADYSSSHFNMVRPGLIIYGLYPAEGLSINIKPLLSLKTKVVFIKKMPKGSGVSYGHIYTTPQETRVATIPIGYGDGYPRNLSNIAPVLIGGKRFTVSGRVCMDQIMIDIGKARISVGDEVTLIGPQGRQKITTEEVAALAGTIPYEIVCGLGSRVPRIYIE